MTALAMDRLTDQLGTPEEVLPQLLSFPVAADTIIYGGALVALDASGNAVPASASSALRCVGRCEKQADNRTLAHGGPGAGTAGLIQVQVHAGVFYFNAGAGIDAISAARMQLVFASDDNTVNTTDGGGLRPAAGLVLNVRSDGQVGVLVGFPSLYQVNPEIAATAFKARNVATSIAAFTVTAGVLLADANGALGAQDGVTNAVGDTIIIPVGAIGAMTVLAADSGPWTLLSIGGAGKFQARRPAWWANGSAILPGSSIAVGGEGTLFKGSNWKTFAAASVVIGTGDPLLYPDKVTQKVTLSSGTKSITNIPIRHADWTGVSVAVNGGTPAATSTAFQTKLSGGIVAGVTGTGTIVVEAQSVVGTIVNTDVTVLNVTITQ